jgi:feruloyl esterase
MKHLLAGGLQVVLLVAGFYSSASAANKSCAGLAQLTLPNMKISVAEAVPEGDFTLPTSGPEAGLKFKDLPAFCRVAATLTPSRDSDIKVEVWMPTATWNGKFQAVGNGRWAGVISYPAMSEALRRGYATSSTDTGHTGDTGSFAYEHPEKFVDFAYRSEHEMTVKAKAIIDAFYGNGPRISYWNGCSTGGRQGLVEAQRYPSDYNAIIAGAPANNRTHVYFWAVSVAQTMHKDEASYIPPSKYAAIHEAVLDACDALDGLKDGLIGDPRLCHFDPKVLACKGADGPSCLTASQVEAARAMYAAAKNPRTGQEIYPGLEPGSELGWAIHGGPLPQSLSTAADGFKYITFKNPDWDYHTLNLDSDVVFADKVDNGMTSAMDPNLKEFFGHGGKLLMYHGWSDPNIAPLNTINYYESVVDKMGGADKTAAWIRLFMAPGMGHCGGGEGPNSFDVVNAIEQWVENQKAPAQMIASHSTDGRVFNFGGPEAQGRVDRTRPLCPYPQVARYKGTGSIDDAANFVCTSP